MQSGFMEVLCFSFGKVALLTPYLAHPTSSELYIASSPPRPHGARVQSRCGISSSFPRRACLITWSSPRHGELFFGSCKLRIKWMMLGLWGDWHEQKYVPPTYFSSSHQRVKPPFNSLVLSFLDRPVHLERSRLRLSRHLTGRLSRLGPGTRTRCRAACPLLLHPSSDLSRRERHLLPR